MPSDNNFLLVPAYFFYRGAKKKFKFDFTNRKVFDNLTTGAVITSNHFSIYDSLPIIDLQLHMKDRQRIYKVIQEANYNMKGVFGVFMRNNYTLPLSRSIREMGRFLRACVKKHTDNFSNSQCSDSISRRQTFSYIQGRGQLIYRG